MTEFESIYKAHFSDVYRYILRLSNSESIAEEITSDTFFKAMSALDKFRGECDIRVWLCQIAKNSYRTYLKKHGMTVSSDDADLTWLPDTADTPDEKVADSDETTRIRMILHNIPEPYKEVFIWRVYAELSFKQIAQMFGKTDNWACVTYHRARKMIIERMEEENVK